MSHDTEHKTRIDDLVSQRPAGFTETPQLQREADIATSTHQSVESSPDRKKGRRRGLKIGLAAAVATALTAGGAYLLTSDNEKTADDQQEQGNEQVDPNNGQNPDDLINNEAPEVVAPEDPTDDPEVVAPTELRFNTSEGFSSEKYPTPESLAQGLFTDAITEWYNAGGTDENFEALIASHLETREFVARVTEPVDDEYINAIFAEGWESNPEVATWIERMERIHLDNVQYNLITRNVDGTAPEDKEPYYRGSELVQLVETSSLTDTQLTMTIDTREHDNASNNRVGEELSDNIQVRGETNRATIGWTLIENQWMITSFHYVGEV